MVKGEGIMQKRWTKERTDFLIKNYATMSNLTLAKCLGTTRIAIGRKSDKLHLKKNKPGDNLIHNYFQKPSSDMYYILGFIVADGCIIDTFKEHRLCFGLNIKDRCILEYICQQVNYPVERIKDTVEKVKKLELKDGDVIVLKNLMSWSLYLPQVLMVLWL